MWGSWVEAAAARPPEKILTVPVRAEDWKLKQLQHIRVGQLGLLREKKKTHLLVYVLKGKPPQTSKAPPKSEVPPHRGNCYVISHFDKGPKNRLGGYYNRFQRAPSSADAAVRSNKQGVNALILSYNKASSGFCGMWMHFFSFKQNVTQRRYLNAKPFGYLSFWIRGTQGGERILLKMADAAWERKGDALPVGTLRSFLPNKRITTTWQRVMLPLKHLPKKLDRSMLASFVLEALHGKGQVEVKTMALCRRELPQPKLPPMPRQQPPQVTTKRPPPPRRVKPPLRHQTGPAPLAIARIRKASWLWESRKFLGNPTRQRKMVQFLKRNGFDAVFLQIPHNPRLLLKQAPKALSVEAWRPWLAELHKHNIKVYALDGFKKYALPNWHDRVLEWANQVVAYNQKVHPKERFDGFHLDIEPYLLSSLWTSRRQWLAQNYLQVLSRLKKLAHQNRMPLGVDIPFWYDEKDPYAKAGFKITYKGKKKPLNEHVIDLVDRVGIMDYRTAVYGADGVIAHALGELSYASQQNKQILIGLETFPLPEEFLLQFRGKPRSTWPDVSGTKPPASFVFLLPPSEAAKLKEPTLTKKPDASSKKTQAKTKPSESQISIPIAGGSTTKAVRGETALFAWVPRYRLKAWQARLQQSKIDPAQLLHWPVHNTIYVSPDKLSFARLGHGSLHKALLSLQKELKRFSAFSGFAIHSIHSYKKLLHRSP
ncbi:MAG: hypothetical protein EP343_12010 [Deltaproteobacteria bacterium]|nr:MAG: hypothetical protein EP343_12010 [Deltaproteobacteria bacterium]